MQDDTFCFQSSSETGICVHMQAAFIRQLYPQGQTDAVSRRPRPTSRKTLYLLFSISKFEIVHLPKLNLRN